MQVVKHASNGLILTLKPMQVQVLVQMSPEVQNRVISGPQKNLYPPF